MKKLMAYLLVSVLALTVPVVSSFAMDHDKMMGMSNVAHQEVVDGVTAFSKL